MFATLLTVLLFAGSAVAGEHTARHWGSQRGNLLRLLLATILMGAITLAFFPDSIRPDTLSWLLLSGLLGFGLGDVALFFAYLRIGARLTILLNLCTAPLWSSLVEWLWLGTTLGPMQLLAGGVILAGVALAVSSREATGMPRVGSRGVGILCGLTAGFGQGCGAVLSRKAVTLAQAGAFDLNGFSAAAQRVSGGLLYTLVFYLATRALGKSGAPLPLEAGTRGKAIGWLLATAFCGPILGVSCFQWALIQLPAGIVTAVVATTPIAMIPLIILVNGERPRPMSIAGACIAVAGVLALLNAR
jgi:drug/metabolite transporter (DMT)-like permease